MAKSKEFLKIKKALQQVKKLKRSKDYKALDKKGFDKLMDKL